MSVFQKISLTLLVSVVLFAGAAMAAYTGLFDVIETRFYNPSITKSLQRATARDAEVVQELFYDLQDRFMSSLNEPAVRQSFLPAYNVEDVFERARCFGLLLESVSGLQSVRFVDSSGLEILFSTQKEDIAGGDEIQTVYRPYGAGLSDPPFAGVRVPEGGHSRLLLERGRLVFSFPFNDAFDVYRGTAIFTLSERAALDRLVKAGRLKPGDDVSVIAVPPGIVYGLPSVSDTEILAAVSSAWNEGSLNAAFFVSAYGNMLALFSAKTSQGVFCGRLVNGNLFIFPLPMKIILLASFFLTVFLAVFFCLNAKPDPLTVVQNRFKRLQFALIEQLFDHKGDVDWLRWAAELEQWREDIHAELKRGIRFGKGRRSEKDADVLIDKAWDELLVIAGSRKAGGLDEEKIRATLNRILNAGGANAPSGGTLSAEGAPAAETVPYLAAGSFDKDDGELEELEVVEEDGAGNAAADIQRGAALPEGEPYLKKGGGLLSAVARKQLIDRAKNVKKKSNVRIAFDGDDIPYIVESSGLEIVDDEDIDNAIQSVQEDNSSHQSAAAQPLTLAEISSEIEFGDMPETTVGADDAGAIAAAQLEVVSPFAAMFSPQEAAENRQPGGGAKTGAAAAPNAAQGGTSPDAGVSLLENGSLVLGMPVMHRPFRDSLGLEPALLESVADDVPETLQVQSSEDVIIQQNGIHYINSSIVNHYDRENLNSKFRELVESVVART